MAISVYEQNKSRQDTLRSAPPFHPSGLQLSPPCVDDALTVTRVAVVKQAGRGAPRALVAS